MVIVNMFRGKMVVWEPVTLFEKIQAWSALPILMISTLFLAYYAYKNSSQGMTMVFVTLVILPLLFFI